MLIYIYIIHFLLGISKILVSVAFCHFLIKMEKNVYSSPIPFSFTLSDFNCIELDFRYLEILPYL